MLGAMDRTEFAHFLRACRARITPADVGLAPGARRRIPGLRREEVAQLTGMSADYYIRLEQGRGPHPSTQLLAALARALRLSSDERDHLYHLADQPPPAPSHPTGHVKPALLKLLDRLTDTPAQVLSDLGEILAQNPLAAALFRGGLGRNIIWDWFADPASRQLFPAEERAHHARAHVAHLRATTGRRRSPEVTDLVDRLLAVSDEFRTLWDAHEVAVRRADTKTVLHPSVGRIELDCEELLTPEHDQTLLLYSPRPGTDAAQKLELLRVVGVQDLGTSQETLSLFSAGAEPGPE